MYSSLCGRGFSKQAAGLLQTKLSPPERSLWAAAPCDPTSTLSDEDLESGMCSPAGSPLKSLARLATQFAGRPLLGNLEESLLQKRLMPKIEVMGFKLQLRASGGFCPTQLTIPAVSYFYELHGETLSTPYLRILAEECPPACNGQQQPQEEVHQQQPPIPRSPTGSTTSTTTSKLGHFITAEQMKRLRYSIHLRFQTSRSGRLSLHTDIRLLISRRTDCDTAAAHAKGVLEAPNELVTDTHLPTELLLHCPCPSPSPFPFPCPILQLDSASLDELFRSLHDPQC
ncbi:GL10078 [Drosophila persimilis]|uniref:GL10078 n=1 Tax=Drosophila persimilis TaxID=7234 RepID=B4IRR8_DROPE|nr:GL10078 [Drosophila persimilis]